MNITTARVALRDGALDAERVIAMLRVRRYTLQRLLVCGNLLEVDVVAADEVAAELLGPRLQRLVGVELLADVSTAERR